MTKRQPRIVTYPYVLPVPRKIAPRRREQQMSELIIEQAIIDARTVAQSTLDPADSRRLRSLGYLAEAESHVQQARAAVARALAEVRSAPAEEGGDGEGIRVVRRIV